MPNRYQGWDGLPNAQDTRLGYCLKHQEILTMAKAERRKRQDAANEDRQPSDASNLPVAHIPPEFAAVWERHRQKYGDRLAVVEQAIQALAAGQLAEPLRQQAHQEAHTLIGSLGSFGLEKASQLCRQIEQKFKLTGGLKQADAFDLAELAKVIRHEMGLTYDPESGTESELLERIGMGEGVPVLTSAALLVDVLPTRLSSSFATFPSHPRLLIVEDDTALAEQIVAEAIAMGIQSSVAVNLEQARAAIAAHRPDVILLDLSFPDTNEDGFALLAELNHQPSPIPTVVFTVHHSFLDRVRVARLGGLAFLQKPIAPQKVVETLIQVLQFSHKPEAKLLIVDDDAALLDFLRSLLQPWGFRLTLLEDPQLFWETLEQSTPDLLILDIDMPNFSGIDLCRVVRNDPRWSDLPILFFSSRTDPETITQVFIAGADDYITKPVVESELIARVLNRLERTQILRRLTGVK